VVWFFLFVPVHDLSSLMGHCTGQNTKILEGESVFRHAPARARRHRSRCFLMKNRSRQGSQRGLKWLKMPIHGERPSRKNATLNLDTLTKHATLNLAKTPR